MRVSRFAVPVAVLAILGCGGALVDGADPVPPAPQPSEPVSEPKPEPASEPVPEATPSPAPGVLPPLGEPVFYPDDCTLDRNYGSEGMLANWQRTAKVKRERHGSYTVETVTLENDTTVRIQRGGCDHISEVWEITPAPRGLEPWSAVRMVSRSLRLRDSKDDRPNISSCVERAPTRSEASFEEDLVTCSVRKDGPLLVAVWSFGG